MRAMDRTRLYPHELDHWLALQAPEVRAILESALAEAADAAYVEGYEEGKTEGHADGVFEGHKEGRDRQIWQ